MNFNREDHPHRRRNPLTGAWVLVSPHRTKRPWTGQIEKPIPDTKPEYDPGCYLCPGNNRAGGVKNPTYTGTFSFINDFSALLSDTPPGRDDDFFYQTESVRGMCKVLIFSPSHRLTLPQMGPEDLLKVAEMWQKEYKEISVLPDINYIQIFENKGAMMGCSNPHPHGQIWASQSIPDEILKKCETQAEYLKAHGRPLLLDYVEKELEKKERIVYVNDSFVVLVPYWAVWPYEAMIVPRKQLMSMADFSPADLKFLMDAVRILTIKYDNLFETSFPYSAGMHQSPCDGKEHPGFTWHMLFYPPLLRSATIKKFMVGYELLAGPQRDITPEASAAKLRELSDRHYLHL
ncbi:MAG TPA: galactose-1-phosphate uridylyltransferase [Firmicutes bacterium]|jgi:UDPglucose--hexose-1-phosphate uridylyltransferase|nr:galactose-1-phosphate uridylyltransferase [Bacillota bacterium]